MQVLQLFMILYASQGSRTKMCDTMMCHCMQPKRRTWPSRLNKKSHTHHIRSHTNTPSPPSSFIVGWVGINTIDQFGCLSADGWLQKRNLRLQRSVVLASVRMFQNISVGHVDRVHVFARLGQINRATGKENYRKKMQSDR